MNQIAEIIENPMVMPTRNYNLLQLHISNDSEERCGCGNKAHALVYDHKEPHCKSCLTDALDCKYEIPVEVL